MILNVYNIRDERQGTYGTPLFTDKKPEQMADDYQMTVETLQANIARFSEFAPEKAAEMALRGSSLKDCVLYSVGFFDNKSGEITLVKPELVLRISECFKEASSNA